MPNHSMQTLWRTTGTFIVGWFSCCLFAFNYYFVVVVVVVVVAS
jgi:hypothetical protein